MSDVRNALTKARADLLYLLLDCSNDPLTEILEVLKHIQISVDNQGLVLGGGQDVLFTYTGLVAKLTTDLVAASDFEIDCGTEKTLVLVEPVYDDLRVPLAAGGRGVGNPPSFSQWKDDGAGSVGVYAWHFGDVAVQANEEQLWFESQLPHKYKEGGDIEVHIHWTPAVGGALNEFVKWGLECTWANRNGTFGNTTIITSDASSGATATTSGDTTLVADKHYVTELGDLNGAGKTVSSILSCRIFRNSSHGDDDLAEDAVAFEVDFHFPIDTVGSRTEDDK